MTDRSETPLSAPAAAPTAFSIAVEPQRDAVQIAPRGELDLATVEQLQSPLRELIDGGVARIVIDLRGVEFLDSTGLHALMNAHAQAQRDGWELAIIPGSRTVQRIFEITCTLDRLPFTANGRPASPASPKSAPTSPSAITSITRDRSDPTPPGSAAPQ
jgi:anti-sigma B factor antagonist